MARPQKPYQTSWGEVVPGLYRCPDGRWRINATKKKFTEPDERRAVARFRAEVQPATVDAPTAFAARTSSPVIEAPQPDGDPKLTTYRWARQDLSDIRIEIGEAVVYAAEFWPWLREQLIEQPEYVAKMVGIPELSNLRHLPMPKRSIKLAELIEVYEEQNPSTPRSKRAAINTFRRLARHTQAKTLDDLTQEKLSAWRQRVEGDSKLTSAGTRAGMYGHIKTIISFGLKVGFDQLQLRAALDRCKVLWTAEPLSPMKPEPISKADFHKLLRASDDTWRAWLLLAMNLCMTAEDLCQLRWEDFNLKQKTYSAIRVKTRRDRIPRAGVLWKETIAAMMKLPKRSKYVFTSTHGSKYSKNSRVNLFAKLRAKAGLPNTLKMNHIRDGAYTVACQATTDERWARVLAGHRAAGLQDNYVLRNPQATKEACEAVYKTYGPFKLA